MKAFTIYNKQSEPVRIVMAETIVKADKTQENEEDYSDLVVMESTPEQIQIK